MEMGGTTDNLQVHLLAENSDTEKLAEPLNPTDANSAGSFAEVLKRFDARDARCFTDYDTQRLHGVIDVAGHDEITNLVKEVFIGVAGYDDTV